MTVRPKELIEAALAVEIVDAATVEEVERRARRSGEDLLEAVASRCRVPPAMFFRAAAESWGFPFVDVDERTADSQWVSRVPIAMRRRAQVLPITDEGEHVLVAAADPRNAATRVALERLLARPVKFGLADPRALARAIASGAKDGGGVNGSEEDPTARLDRTIREAFLRRASDVHVEPVQGGYRIRLRVDGRLREAESGIDRDSGQALVSRIKVLAGLDIAEQRSPQDGGLTYAGVGDGLDVRVATVPTAYGERATLRLLGTAGEVLSLNELGMGQAAVDRFRDAIREPHGMILLTGPTGSGKSTTLYAALSEVNDPDKNIMTVEDPIEHPIPGIAQVQIGGSKVTFASALRSLLRHDPDILMLGEIRDHETAEIALRAAMTGHLLFSTLHTNDACSAVTRLRDIGCEPFLIGSTLLGVIAQRLVMRLCPRCRTTRDATSRELLMLGEGFEGPVYEPGGCAQCLGTGFKGRVGVFEMLWVDRELGARISAGEGEDELRAAAGDRLITMSEDAICKVRLGLTTFDEILRVVRVEKA